MQKKPWLIFIALALSVFVGSILTKDTTTYTIVGVVGTLFLNALTLVVVPLVASSIITGVATIASEEQFGRLGLKTFSLFLFTNLLAIGIGVSLTALFAPGKGFNLADLPVTSRPNVEMGESGPFVSLLFDLIPPNILAAFAKGNMLGLIFFSLIFGYAITKIKKNQFEVHFQFWKGIFEAMLKIVHGIMYFLPIGVFCLATKIFTDIGIQSLKPLGNFIWMSLLALSLFAFGVLPLLLKTIGKVSPLRYFRAVFPALITAFSTGSSSATLPIALDSMEKRAGLSNRICSLVIPLGTTLNLAGTALYNGMALIFIAQASGAPLAASDLLLYTFATLLVSLGVASIPGGGLIVGITLIRIFGLPPEGVGVLVALDRILDMFRTSVNLFTYTANATILAKSEGEKNILSNKELDPI